MGLFRRKQPEAASGEIADKFNSDLSLTIEDLMNYVKDGRATLCLPIDNRVSPWLAPKMIALSALQAIEYIDALGKSEKRHSVSWIARSDDSITIIPKREAFNAVNDHDLLPVCRPPPLPADYNSGQSRGHDDVLLLCNPTNSSEMG